MQNKLEIIKETKYLSFIVKEHKPKTKVVAVVNKTYQEEIGVIRWYSTWRQYCFFPHQNTIWNTGCLNDVNDMIAELKPVRPKPKQKTIGVIAFTIQDFLNWKHKKKHKSIGTTRKYVRGNTTYVCITKPCDVRGYTIDKVIETEQAYLNPKIVDIMTVIQPNIRPQKKP